MNSRMLACGLLALSVGAMTSVHAQGADDPDWKESEVPAPPAFDFGKVVTFASSNGNALVYGVDPAAVTISKSDSLVRYVMVATSASGARNVMYEAIRCSTGEFKTYARYSADGKWTPLKDPQWRTMFGNLPSKHALQFARAGACDNAAPVQNLSVLVSRLKNPNYGMGSN